MISSWSMGRDHWGQLPTGHPLACLTISICKGHSQEVCIRMRVGVGHRMETTDKSGRIGTWQDDGHITYYTSHEHWRSGALRVQDMASSSQHVIGDP